MGNPERGAPITTETIPTVSLGGEQETIYGISISTVWTGRGTPAPNSEHYDYGTIYLGLNGDEVIFLCEVSYRHLNIHE